MEKSQEYLRLALAAAAILIGLSVAYHYVIYIPEKDQALKLEADSKSQTEAIQAAANKADADKAALNRRTNYRICVSNALADYRTRWDTTCKRKSDEADKNRAECVANGSLEATCERYYPPVPAANCALPSAQSDDYDASLKNDQKQCLDEANAGVLDSTE